MIITKLKKTAIALVYCFLLLISVPFTKYCFLFYVLKPSIFIECLYLSPLSFHYYPFTPPVVNPATKNFWQEIKTIKIGIRLNTDSAKT